jgi:hypothetical protein
MQVAALKNCCGCGAPLTAQSDSAAHVFPNALGGRLKPKGIICRHCNTALDRAADNALVKAFGDWPTLLNLPRDEGGHPPKLVDTRDGRRVRIEADGNITSVQVTFEAAEIENGHQVTIAAGNMQTFRQLLKRAKKQFPQLDIHAAEQAARVVGVADDDMLKLGFDFSPQAVFGGVVTAIWLYLIHTTGRAFMDWNRLLKCIGEMQTHGGTFRYLVDGLPGLIGPDIPLGHKIIVRSVPHSGEMIAYVEVMGILRVGGLFASAGGPSELIEHVYAYDLVQQRDRSAEFWINPDEFERQDWRAAGRGPTDAKALRDHFANALQVFVDHYRQRFILKPDSDAPPVTN